MEAVDPQNEIEKRVKNLTDIQSSKSHDQANEYEAFYDLCSELNQIARANQKIAVRAIVERKHSGIPTIVTRAYGKRITAISSFKEGRKIVQYEADKWTMGSIIEWNGQDFTVGNSIRSKSVIINDWYDYLASWLVNDYPKIQSQKFLNNISWGMLGLMLLVFIIFTIRNF